MKSRAWIILGICVALISCGLFYGCQGAKGGTLQRPAGYQGTSIRQIAGQLQDGDIVLRAGNDMTSNMLRQLNLRDQRFSHCGIVYRSGDTCWVYHSIGSEQYPEQPLKKENLDQFFAAEQNMAVGFAHMALHTGEQKRLKTVLDSFYTQKIPFDMQFDLKTDDKMYCSEMVAKALLSSVPDIRLAPTDTLGKQYWSIDNITTNDRVREIRYLRRE